MTALVRLLAFFVFAIVLTMPALCADQARPEERPVEKVAFPPIKDWSTLEIRLQRTGCYGWCPVYSVTISGDGTVSFLGERFVTVKGAHTAKITPDKVRALYEAFVKADFFWAFDRYEASITDLPTKIVSISFDGHRKQIVDYAGRMAGMPEAIAKLEQQIDELAGITQWVGHEREP